MKTKQELQRELEALQLRIEQINKEMKKPVVGRWYRKELAYNGHFKFKDVIGVYKGCRNRDGISSYGFNANGDFTTNLYFNSNDPMIEMTAEEIKAALVKHCEGLGIKEGVKIDRSGMDSSSYYKEEEVFISSSPPYYYLESDVLCIGGYIVYEQGKFATLVKDKPLTVGGFEVRVGVFAVKINDKHYNETLDQLIEMFNSGKIDSVTIQGEVCDLENIKAIRNLIK